MTDDRSQLVVRDAIEYLGSVSISGYRASRLPCPTDDEIRRICKAFESGAPDQRRELSSALDDRSGPPLAVYAERMSMLSVRQATCSHLHSALVALAMLDTRNTELRMDCYTLLMVLSVVVRSATRLGCDTHALCRDALQYTDREHTRNLIMGYFKRDPSNQAIEDMGYHEYYGPAGLVYWHGRGPVPEELLNG
jgi:hypothetical protein